VRSISKSNVNSSSLYQLLDETSQPLSLSHEQVIYHAKQVQKMRHLYKLKQDLCKTLEQEPTLSQWASQAQLSERDLKASLRQGEKAKEKLIAANLRLVTSIARRYQHWGVDWQDLVQEGIIGLNRAIEKFDPTKGCRLNTYAKWWIRRQMSRATAAPKGIDDLSQAESQSTPMSISLNSLISDEEDMEALDLLPSEEPLPEDSVAQRQSVELVKQLLKHLPLKERNILNHLYGLEGQNILSLSKAGEQLGLSRDQIRYAHSQTLKALRNKAPKASALIS